MKRTSNPLITNDTPRWSDNDLRAKAAQKAARTRLTNRASRKYWNEVTAPGKRRVANLLEYLLKEHGPIDVSWNPARDNGRKLKHGAQHGKLIALEDGFYFIVQIDGYKRPQTFHPSFWEILLPDKKGPGR
jgi:hypothetical protein